jgi:hypothetical protein
MWKKQTLLFLVFWIGWQHCLVADDRSVSSVVIEKKRESCKVEIFGDFLYWFVSEEPSSSWALIGGSTISPGVISDTFETKGASFDWTSGFRTGASVLWGKRHQYDSKLFWTYLRTNAKSSIPTTGKLIYPQFLGCFLNGDHPKNGNLHWSLLFDMFDWELGHYYTPCKTLLFRPMIGLKGGWIFQSLRSQWQVNSREINGVLTPVDYVAKENVKNDFWGIGPSVGMDSLWTFVHIDNHLLHFFGDFSAALMWGSWKSKDAYFNTSSQEFFVQTKKSELGDFMVRCFMGIGWEVVGKSVCFATKIGYEMQFWSNQFRWPNLQQDRVHGDLTLQGGTFHCRLGF